MVWCFRIYVIFRSHAIVPTFSLMTGGGGGRKPSTLERPPLDLDVPRHNKSTNRVTGKHASYTSTTEHNNRDFFSRKGTYEWAMRQSFSGEHTRRPLGRPTGAQQMVLLPNRSATVAAACRVYPLAWRVVAPVYHIHAKGVQPLQHQTKEREPRQAHRRPLGVPAGRAGVLQKGFRKRLT